MATLTTLLLALLAAVFAVVLFSYTIAWYEYANRDPSLVGRRFSPRPLLSISWTMVQETLLLTFTVLLHPFGWIRSRVRTEKSPSQPVLLLHGLFHNKACWLFARLVLRIQGKTSLHTLNLPPWRDIETLTESVAKRVDEIRHAQGVEKVALVGHSMGGIIARNYLQQRGGADKVSHLVLLGTPNTGSKLAPFALSPLGAHLQPGSEFLIRLAQAPLPEGTAVTSIYSRQDNMVLPFEHGSLEGAADVQLADIGHISLLYHPRALAAVVRALDGGAGS